MCKMARVMQDTIRQKKREVLRASTSISMSFDDRAGYKLVLFRASLVGSPHAASQGASAAERPAASQEPAAASPLKIASEGLLGCIQCLRGSTLEDFADDYAERAGREIMSLLTRFCTPLGDTFDDALYEHIRVNVRSMCADGALQKVAQLLRVSSFPNVVLIQRDPAHFIRIACKEPLVRTGRFEEQHARLFTNKRALLKSVQFSDSLQARLEACQRVVLRNGGQQGGGVQHIMRHFSFAPHRFESWTGPRRKYACCLHAVALLLCDLAGDNRRPAHERREAEAALASMTPQNMLEVGLAGDFGEICMRRLGMHRIKSTLTLHQMHSHCGVRLPIMSLGSSGSSTRQTATPRKLVRASTTSRRHCAQCSRMGMFFAHQQGIQLHRGIRQERHHHQGMPPHRGIRMERKDHQGFQVHRWIQLNRRRSGPHP